MWGKGKLYGTFIILLVILLAVVSFWYTQQLANEREARIATLLSTPEYAHCLYDGSTCPQIEGNIQMPNLLGLAVILIVLVMAGYLWKSDRMQQQILKELRESDEQEQEKYKLDLILSVLKKEERKVLNAIKEQDGITQSTLKLRTDFSKAKLSSLLKELEARGLVVKEQDGKTNKLHLKRKL